MTGGIPKSTLVLALILVVVGASGAVATDDGVDSNVLTGCRNRTTGLIDQVRPGLLPLGRGCGLGEVKVSWNKTGPQGPPGPAGGIDGLYRKYEKRSYFDQGVAGFDVMCDEGDHVIGGGAAVSGSGMAWLYVSRPVGNGWRAWAGVDTQYVGDDGWHVEIWAFCVGAS